MAPRKRQATSRFRVRKDTTASQAAQIVAPRTRRDRRNTTDVPHEKGIKSREAISPPPSAGKPDLLPPDDDTDEELVTPPPRKVAKRNSHASTRLRCGIASFRNSTDPAPASALRETADEISPVCSDPAEAEGLYSSGRVMPPPTPLAVRMRRANSRPGRAGATRSRPQPAIVRSLAIQPVARSQVNSRPTAAAPSNIGGRTQTPDSAGWEGTEGRVIESLRAERDSLKRRVQTLETERREMLTMANALKAKASRMEQVKVQQDITAKAMTNELNRLQEEVRHLQHLHESLSASNQRELVPVKKHSKAGKETQLNVKPAFMGVASMLLDRLTFLCTRETQEMSLDPQDYQHRWQGRCMEARTEYSMIKLGDSHYIPFFPLALSLARAYYTSSHSNDCSLLRDMAKLEVEHPKWKTLFSTSEIESCIVDISEDEYMLRRLKTTCSTVISTRKRNARDKLLDALGYGMLLSRTRTSASRTHEAEKEVQLIEATEKLLWMKEDGTEDLSRWRMAPVEDLCYSEAKCHDSLVGENSNDLLFKNKLGIVVLNEFQGYDATSAKYSNMQASIMVLARLDAWLWTVVKCLSKPKGRGGNRLKLFNEEYSRLLPLAVMGLLAEIRIFVLSLEPSEVDIENEDVGEDGLFVGEGTRIMTRVFSDKLDHKMYLAVDERWFKDNVTQHLGQVCDAYIGIFDGNGQAFKALEICAAHEGSADDNGALPVEGVNVEAGDTTPPPGNITGTP